jgi:putative transposase
MLIDVAHPRLSLLRQCELIGLPRSSWYYQSLHAQGQDGYSQQLMRLIDQLYTDHPYLGVRRMTAMLRRDGHGVNLKRVRRLMRVMGLETVYPRPKRVLTSVRDQDDAVYPYLLKGLKIERPDQVWASDITYVPLTPSGWVYVTAVMDWYSRYVLSWKLSSSLSSDFCVRALQSALALGTPQIFNSDRGCQFTAASFTQVLKDAGVRIGMAGVGRAYDNIFVERLWRSLKHEEVYLHEYERLSAALQGIGAWFEFYNHGRPHQALSYRTPAELYGIRTSARAGSDDHHDSGDDAVGLCTNVNRTKCAST